MNDWRDVLALLILIAMIGAILLMVWFIIDDGDTKSEVRRLCLEAGYTEYWIARDDQGYCMKLVNGNTKVLKLED